MLEPNYLTLWYRWTLVINPFNSIERSGRWKKHHRGSLNRIKAAALHLYGMDGPFFFIKQSTQNSQVTGKNPLLPPGSK